MCNVLKEKCGENFDSLEVKVCRIKGKWTNKPLCVGVLKVNSSVELKSSLSGAFFCRLCSYLRFSVKAHPFFCLNLLSLCSLLLWHRCRAHLFQGHCEMISVLTNINTQPDPINKLLLVSCLARSQENLATARQVQICWGEKSVGSTVCVCVFSQRLFVFLCHLHFVFIARTP